MAGIKFDQFVEDCAHGVHDLATDALTGFLHATSPAAGDEVLATLSARGAGLVTTNLGSMVFGTPTTAVQTSGTYTLLLPDLLIAASGAVADFRYAGIYNDTPTSPADPVVCYWDYGSTITGMNSGDDFTFDFTTSTLTLA